MRKFEEATKLAEEGKTEQAVDAYIASFDEEGTPEELLTAAVYILENDNNYGPAYACFLELYKQGFYREQILSILNMVFFEPNIKEIRNRYERNCRLLRRYPYIFRQDFPDFEDLPLKFYPYDDNGYVPFIISEAKFKDYVNLRDTIITRNFFKDLEKPVLATDVFSQYELEYLTDSIRPSEYVARDNHLYLHYTDWKVFCSWLQVLNIRPLLDKKKVVFLFEDEIEQYPIDFKERFGIDYSQNTIKPIGLREIKRMILHTQLSSHNGGDFFNEIFDNHPNLLTISSIMLDNAEDSVKKIDDKLKEASSLEEAQEFFAGWSNPRLIAELYNIHDRTPKDLFIAMHLGTRGVRRGLDPSARIAPIVLFQPHFPLVHYGLEVDQYGQTVLDSKDAESLRNSPILRSFKYIKTFTPLRRFTTSYGAEVKFMWNVFLEENGKLKESDARLAAEVLGEEAQNIETADNTDAKQEVNGNEETNADAKQEVNGNEETSAEAKREVSEANTSVTTENQDEDDKDDTDKKGETRHVVIDSLILRLLNRSFMRDPLDRLERDSVIVRFEDGKLNPKATFTALAAFLDIPYTESMTYCSVCGEHDTVSMEGNALGFDPSTVYRTYDEFANDDERYFLEYFLRDAYENYGYDFHYYDGKEMDMERAKTLIDGFTTINHYILESRKSYYRYVLLKQYKARKEKQEAAKEGKVAEDVKEEEKEEEKELPFDERLQKILDDELEEYKENRIKVAKYLMYDLHFVNYLGHPLDMIPHLQLDPELLEQPLYR